MSAAALVERTRQLMAKTRTKAVEHEFTPIPAGHLMVGDQLIWGEQAVIVVALFFPTTVPKFVVTVDNGVTQSPLHLLTHEEVLVLLPRPFNGMEARK